jgi:hypothetical protein
MNEEINEKKDGKYAWFLFTIMSILIILSSVFFMAYPEITFNISMEYPGSPLTWESLDEGTKAGMYFLILRPFWDEILFGVFGLFCAWGLKKRESYAWNISIFWSAMMLVAGITLGLSEIFVGKWTSICVVTYLYSFIGVIALVCLFVFKKTIRYAYIK